MYSLYVYLLYAHYYVCIKVCTVCDKINKMHISITTNNLMCRIWYIRMCMYVFTVCMYVCMYVCM